MDGNGGQAALDAREAVALVTGASSGIGREVAVQLGHAGLALALVARRKAALEETARLARAQRCMVLPGDIADVRHSRACVARVVGELGRLDVLVNCAGVAPVAPIAATTDELLVTTFAINTFAPARLIAAAWPTFEAQRSGCVVNVSTMGSIEPFDGFFVYAASKSAMDSLTRSVAREGAPLGIRAYSVNPGAVETPMLRAIVDEARLPRSKALSPSHVAEIVVGLALGRRSEKSGAVVRVPSP